MDLTFRILELVKWLEWALDLIDMYDERLATIDGPMVYTQAHTEAKERVRKLVQEYKQTPNYEEMPKGTS
jgi:hypothetical protein